MRVRCGFEMKPRRLELPALEPEIKRWCGALLLFSAFIPRRNLVVPRDFQCAERRKYFLQVER